MSKAYKVGTHVKSHYRAPWKGVIVASAQDHDLTITPVWVTRENQRVKGPFPVYHKNPEFVIWPFPCSCKECRAKNPPLYSLCHEKMVVVKATHDRNGKPLRKPFWVCLSSDWLEIVSSPKEL